MDTLHDTWKVMKPFVHFSVKAMKLLTHALIYIVKHVPKPEEHEKAKSSKVIKIWSTLFLNHDLLDFKIEG